MKTYVLPIVAAILASVLVVGGLAWATGASDALEFGTASPEVEGVFSISGEVSLEGGDLTLPFSCKLEVLKGQEPQVRELKIGENGVALSVPRVIQRQIDESLQDWGRIVGDAASLAVGPIKMGFYIDALRVDLVVAADSDVPNPYEYREVTTEADHPISPPYPAEPAEPAEPASP